MNNFKKILFYFSILLGPAITTNNLQASAEDYYSTSAYTPNTPTNTTKAQTISLEAPASPASIAASAASTTSAPTKSGSSSTEEITVLQQKNKALIADTTKRKTTIESLKKKTNINKNDEQKQIKNEQNAITKNNDQITINNKKIAALQKPSAQSRSTSLGRLSSNKASKKYIKNR